MEEDFEEGFELYPTPPPEPKPVVKVTSLDDFELPEHGTVDIPRALGDDLRIPIKAISLAEQDRMADDCKAPPPPRKFDKKGHFTVSGKPGWYIDETDPLYLSLVEDVNKRQSKMLTLAGLDIKIEGADVDAKWANLSEKLSVGDQAMILGAVLELSNVNDDAISDAKNYLNLG